MFACSHTSYAYNEKTYIPEKADRLVPIVKAEQIKYFPDFPYPPYFMALAEHESCISLTHKRCMDPSSRLKTHREEGGGIFQLTKAYTSSGKIRFDSLSGMRKQHMAELKELEWKTLYQRTDLQIRAGILMTRDNWKTLYAIENSFDRLQFTDSAYNGGMGNVNKRRRVCGLKSGCNPQKWFNHTEKACPGLNRVLYGNRTACDINNHHVRNVLLTKMPKYQTLYGKPLPVETESPDIVFPIGKVTYSLDIKQDPDNVAIVTAIAAIASKQSQEILTLHFIWTPY